ncbi:Hexuronate transporter [termite gut metagenome]|jgi:ACS family hexuronate transporter-like MFS transporter|uniref:Hexuronate transporter n=1 Tax=termite gut metagenome TaxID=433724 RepID=A0A5J4T0T8_9ZZZZ
MKNSYRWRICGLLFFATTINYVDRQVLSILAPQLQEIFNWSEKDYGYIIMAFQIAYALGLLFTGRFLDKFGVRIGYSIAIAVWSIFAAFHALAVSVFSFAVARFGLALGESANFPASIKTVAEWFPKKERALATGIFNSGSTIGAIIAPLLIPFLAVNFGWQFAFLVTSLLGFVWLIFWIPFYKSPNKIPAVSKEELEHINSDKEPETRHSISWSKLFTYKQTLGICLGRFVTDPIWWFFLYWLPKYLSEQHGLNIQGMGFPLIIIYVFSSVGGISGGWLSSHFIKRGKSIDFARKTTILIFALLVTPVFLLTYFSSLTLAIVLISFAAAAHQAWASNIFTVVSDIYPKNAIGSMTGLSGFWGAMGGIIFAPVVGFILDTTGSYHIIFAIVSCAYLLAWLFLKIFVRKIEPLNVISLDGSK